MSCWPAPPVEVCPHVLGEESLPSTLSPSRWFPCALRAQTTRRGQAGALGWQAEPVWTFVTLPCPWLGTPPVCTHVPEGAWWWVWFLTAACPAPRPVRSVPRAVPARRPKSVPAQLCPEAKGPVSCSGLDPPAHPCDLALPPTASWSLSVWPAAPPPPPLPTPPLQLLLHTRWPCVILVVLLCVATSPWTCRSRLLLGAMERTRQGFALRGFCFPRSY